MTEPLKCTVEIKQLEDTYLCLHERVGEVESDNGTFEIIRSVPMADLIISTPDGSKYGVFMKELIVAAVEAIDNAPEE